jgi:membrane protease subunit (stomatin/prohibitin family)
MGLKNKITAGIFLSCIMGVLAIGTAFAQDLIIYPKEGQNQEQMEKDKYACYTWAKDQTGFDPMASAQAVSQPSQQPPPQGGAVKGAARGALVGVAVGATAGGIGGRMRQNDQKHQQAQANAQQAQAQQNAYNQNMGNYNRAYGACLEAKGYTVK